MSPEQLEAAAAKALRRKQDGDTRANVCLLRFTTSAPEVTRGKVEGVLDQRAKQWSFVGIQPADNGGRRLEYTVTLKKKDTSDAFLEEMKKSIPELEEVEVR
jgi:hypothetical protein